MEAAIELCTSEKHTQDQWDLILRVCEEYGSKEPKACLKLLNKRLFHKNPNISLRAITLLDACSKNCGKVFNRELASRDFSQLVKNKFSNLQQLPSIKLTEVFQKWAEDFKSDSELALAADLYAWVRSEHPGVILRVQEDLKSTKVGSARKAAATLQAKEEEELAKAIALSLKETGSKKASDPITHQPAASRTSTSGPKDVGTKNQLYTEYHPSTKFNKTPTVSSKGRVRALYDFEAAEDNELTFKAGEIIVLLDDSDENWWRGSNHRGEGLFPAQFVQPEGSEQAQSTSHTNTASQPRIVQTPVRLDEAKLNECLRLLNLADPTNEIRPDPPELNQLESECNAMAPLIDPELEKVDKRVMGLSEVNQRLVDAFQMYHELMTQAPPAQPASYYGGPVGGAGNAFMSYPPAQHQMYYGVNQGQFGGYSTTEQPVYTQPSGIHYPSVQGATAYYSTEQQQEHQQYPAQPSVPQDGMMYAPTKSQMPQHQEAPLPSYAPSPAVPDASFPHTTYAANPFSDQSSITAGITSQPQLHPSIGAPQSHYYGYGSGPDAGSQVNPNFAQSSINPTDSEARS